MFRALIAAILSLCASPVVANDEIAPVPTQAVIGRPYFRGTAHSQIRFINVRLRPVRVMWIAFDGSERNHAVLAPGQEIIQPAFVAHRWLVKDQGDGTPLQAFISTRSAVRDSGTPQIALIR